MLLRFAVRNHLSILEEQSLSMVASSLDDDEDGVITGVGKEAARVLPSVVIYGANASGKSAVVSALDSMRSMILYSHSKMNDGDNIKVFPFILNEESQYQPTEFEVDFLEENMRYNYCFKINKSSIIEEYLYIYPNQRKKLLFHRKNQSYVFGRSFKGHNKIVEDLTRVNSLFISCGSQNKHDYSVKVSSFFKKIKVISSRFPNGESDFLDQMFPEKSSYKDFDDDCLDFLKLVVSGVEDYIIIERKISAQQVTEIENIKRIVNRGGNRFDFDISENSLYILLGHRKYDGSVSYQVKFDMESDGTKRLAAVLPIIYNVIRDGGLLLFDELNINLHTQAAEALLALFACKKTNPKGAQLIATTHDTNLLRSKSLRRDQVWFTEKDQRGATHLYPLTDIRTRKNDNLERGYLQGRYGAIPFAGSPEDII